MRLTDCHLLPSDTFFLPSKKKAGRSNMEDVEAQMAFRKPFARMFMRGKKRQIARKRSTALKLGGGKIPKFKAVSLLRHELHGLTVYP